jgi:1,4-alpha-glucan branching enzyme
VAFAPGDEFVGSRMREWSRKERDVVKKGRKRGTLTFSMRAADGVSEVSVAGDFTDWQPLAMRKRGGAFSIAVPVPPGTHEYKFIVDGHWRTDPDNSDWAANPYNTSNSVVTAEA